MKEGVIIACHLFTVFLSAQSTGNETTMEEELGLVGASADDTEAELIRNICETELLDGKCGCQQGALALAACVKEQVRWVTDREQRLLPSEGNAAIFVQCLFLCGLPVSLLCHSGGGFSMLNQTISVICRSSGIN